MNYSDCKFLENFYNHKILFLTSDRITTNIVIVVSISGLLAYGNGLWVIIVQQLRFVSLSTYIILDIERDRLLREDEMRGQRPTNKVAKEPAKLGGI